MAPPTPEELDQYIIENFPIWHSAKQKIKRRDVINDNEDIIIKYKRFNEMTDDDFNRKKKNKNPNKNKILKKFNTREEAVEKYEKNIKTMVGKIKFYLKYCEGIQLGGKRGKRGGRWLFSHKSRKKKRKRTKKKRRRKKKKTRKRRRKRRR